MTWAVETIAFPPNGAYFWNDADARRCPPVLSVVSRAALKSNHKGGIHIGLTDGSVRFLSQNTNQVTCKNLADRGDGEVLGEFWRLEAGTAIGGQPPRGGVITRYPEAAICSASDRSSVPS